MSLPTGVVPGAGWALGVLSGGVLDGVDCAHAVRARANVNPASATAWEAPRIVLIAHLQHISILAAWSKAGLSRIVEKIEWNRTE
jgi:hypothetical protein